MTKKLTDLPRPERFARVAVFLIVAGIVSIVISVGAYIYFFHRHPMGETEDWGAFGAFISGAAGTALSAFTLAALAFTLALQADELAESRDLANQQFKVLEKQSATMAQQAFDSAFFNLLERFSQVRDSVKFDYDVSRPLPDLRVEYDMVTARGRDAIKRMMKDRIFERYEMAPNSPDRLTFLQSIFKVMYDRHESELGPYFRTLYHIFKFVDRAPKLTEQQKIDYANIARAQLSDTELCVLFYDGLTDLAIKFKPLIERYGVLKHINAKHLLHPDDKTNESFYKRSAFESSRIEIQTDP